MGLFGPFEYKTLKSEKKLKYYLHFKEKGKVKLYFFSKDPIGALPSIPKGYEVIENPNTGMPFLRKTEKGKEDKGKKK